MDQTPRSANFYDVIEAEKKDIRVRRVISGLTDPPDKPETGGNEAAGASGTEIKLVGLALSGGGVRSGAVSLGLLQSLYDRRVLNQFDYLSTVSGGGYAGSYLSAVLEEFPEGTAIDWAPEGKSPGGSKQPLSFAADQNGAQPIEVRRLIHSGVYLRKFRELINSTLLGVFVNWTMLLSGLTALACIVAIVYRFLDTPKLIALLEGAGFANDLSRAFFIPFVILCCWIVACICVLRSSKRAIWTNRASWLAILLIASLACGVVLVLNTSDLDTTSASSGQASRPRVEVTQSLQYWTWAILLTALVVSLLPFLRRNDLLQSGAAPSKRWQPWVAKAAGWGMVAGVPLLVFGIVARENLFDFNKQREDRYELCRLHIRDWVAFARTLESEASDRPLIGPSFTLWEVANGFRDRPANSPAAVRDASSSELPLDKISQSELRRRELQQTTWLLVRWLSIPIAPFETGPCFEQWNAYCNAADLENEAVQRINTLVLNDPTFHRHFPDALPHPREEWMADAYSEACTTARGLEGVAARVDLANVIKKYETVLSEAKPAPVSHATADARSEAREKLSRLLDLRRQVQLANRVLLEYWYWDQIRPASTVFSLVVLPSDQIRRMIIGGAALALFLLLALNVNVNRTSAHSYYRERLADTWVFRRNRTGPSITLSAMRNTERGGPYHLINATVNLMGPHRKTHEEPTDSFLFSRHFCGSERVEYESSKTYDKHGITMADAMAISGAAVTPVAVANSPLLFYVMLLTNARLGQWVPNPGNIISRSCPAFLPALLSYFSRMPDQAEYLYVSDGGQHDNTGIESLLRRRCKIIIACDASWDPQHQFLDLLRLFRRMNVFEGIQFTAPDGGPVRLDAVVPDKQSRLAEDHCVLIRVVYPQSHGPRDDAWILYVKTNLTGNEPPPVLKYREDNKDFPFDPTLDQFYDPRRFECYRELGYELGRHVASRLAADSHSLRSPWLSQLNCSLTCAVGRLLEKAAAPDDAAREKVLQELVERLADRDAPQLKKYVVHKLKGLIEHALESAPIVKQVRHAIEQIMAGEDDAAADEPPAAETWSNEPAPQGEFAKTAAEPSESSEGEAAVNKPR